MAGTPSNDLNISQPGYVVFDGVSTFTGATLQPGSGISISNPSGVSGNSIISSIPTGSLVTTFTSSGTWTKNPSTKYVEVWMFQGGGGGGSGRKGASTAAGGGAGGCGCYGLWYSSPASCFGSSETVTVAALAAGGTSQSSDGTNGIAGSVQNFSSFGNILQLVGTSQAGAGASGVSTGGTVKNANITAGYGPLFAATIANGANGGVSIGGTPATNTATSNILFLSTGGGGGAGYDTGTPRSGGAGGKLIKYDGSNLILGGAGGTEGGTINGSNGNTPLTSGGLYTGGTGGGGGGGPSAGIVAGNGGNGGAPGGGGGGGSGGISTVVSSGAGGNGAPGQVVVVEFF